MAKEIITGDGRIFKQTSQGTFKEQGGRGKEVTGSQIKAYEKYTGVKAVDLKESARTNPQFTNLNWQRSKG